MSNILIQPGFLDAERPVLARLYWSAFGPKLRVIMGAGLRAQAFLAEGLQADHGLVARSTDGTILGVAGFKTANGSFTGGDMALLRKHYGLSAYWRGPVLDLLERPIAPGILLMDGICVAPKARGHGVGTRLLKAIKHEAFRQNMQQVRLDVIDTNTRARALYEREGFVAETTHRLGPLKYVFGFSASTTMLHNIPAPRRNAAN